MHDPICNPKAQLHNGKNFDSLSSISEQLALPRKIKKLRAMMARTTVAHPSLKYVMTIALPSPKQRNFHSFYSYLIPLQNSTHSVRQKGQQGQQVKEKMWMVYYRMKLNKLSSDS